MPNLKIVWISSFLPRSCGIAYYSNEYINALKKLNKIEIEIISHTDATQATYPIIDTNIKSWHLKVLKTIKKIKPDVVHIQHEYGLYETHDDKNARVLILLKKLKQLKIPTVITYHSVYEKLSKDQAFFVSESLKNVSAGILHCQYQKDALPSNIKWKPSNVYVTPHGSSENIKLNKKKCKKRFGYADKNVVGMVGLSSERKAFHRVIKLWPEIAPKLQNTILTIELKPHFSEESIRYISKISTLVAINKARSSMELVIKDYTEKEFYEKLKSFDILVLPYLSESQSGVLAHSFAAATPAVVRDVEGLGYEIKKSKAGIAAKDDKEIKEAIIRLMKDKKLREQMEKNAKRYVKTYCGWSIVAKKTFEIYKKISKK